MIYDRRMNEEGFFLTEPESRFRKTAVVFLAVAH